MDKWPVLCLCDMCTCVCIIHRMGDSLPLRRVTRAMLLFDVIFASTAPLTGLSFFALPRSFYVLSICISHPSKGFRILFHFSTAHDSLISFVCLPTVQCAHIHLRLSFLNSLSLCCVHITGCNHNLSHVVRR